ncbi:DUF4302 domain-containing protein [Sphingobacterium faecium]|uniref:DUF4302 domain-containing protein n=1 Tax=Sphingobacterium faecium TaxID=34087 RepID=UPI0024792E3B|nr:DUF4302 domain-containing protein [Sphingobacterium faecium]WGQ13301.1 DUF4302 domain-containing protein [Sphingobacterium faecium]
MKRIVYICFAAVLFMGCSKDKTDLTFEATPEERIGEKLAEVKSALVSAPFGWIAGMGTSAKGGYGFYIKFDEDDKLTMLSDYSAESATKSVASTYRVKWGSTASLIFDTYNYITLMQDPVPGVAGGAAGKGYQSDIEFNFDRISGDSVIFIGKKYLNPLVLIKATEEEQNKYQAKSFLEDIENFKDYFEDGIPVVKIGDVETEIGINVEGKTMGFIGMPNNIVTGVEVKYYNVIGENIRFIDEVLYNGEYLSSILKESDGYKLLTRSGKKFDIYKSDDYILPPEYKIGAAISSFAVPGPYSYSQYLPMKSWSSLYIVDWNMYLNLSKNGGYNLTIGNTSYTFVAARNEITASCDIYQGSTGFSATYSMKYSIDKDTGYFRFLSLASANGNGGIIVPYMNSTFFANMKDKDFKLSFVNDATFGRAVKFTRVDNPDYFFTWLY